MSELSSLNMFSKLQMKRIWLNSTIWFQLTHKFTTQGTSRYESYSFTEEERRNGMKKAIYTCFFPIRVSERASNLGGGGTGLFTLKHNPWAWLGPWYGSWPRITTFTWNCRRKFGLGDCDRLKDTSDNTSHRKFFMQLSAGEMAAQRGLAQSCIVP